MVTPFLHTYVHKKKGGQIKYMFSKLIDGIHPTIDLNRSWFKHMEKVVSEKDVAIVGKTTFPPNSLICRSVSKMQAFMLET
jgi:hypothetical protein